jgi:hypothetical protein
MHGRQESTDISIRRRSIADAQRGSDGLAGYIVAWSAADGRYPVGDDSRQELADAVGSVREVVARVLQDVHIDRLVATTASLDSIHISEPGRTRRAVLDPAAVSCRVTSVTRPRYRSH